MGSIHHRSNIIIQLESFKIKDDRVVGIKRKKRKKKGEREREKNRGKKGLTDSKKIVSPSTSAVHVQMHAG